MMRDRITFTVSDVHGAWSFSVHSRIKKYAGYVAGTLCLALMSTIVAVQFLGHEVRQLEASNENLSRNVRSLAAENSAMAAYAANSEAQLASVSEKLDGIEVSLGIDPQSEMDIGERLASIGGKAEELVQVEDKLESIETLIGLKPQQEMEITQRVEYANLTATQKHVLLQSIPSGWPLEDTVITGRYGMRNHPVSGERAPHYGIDLRAQMNTPVYATADGIVEYAAHQKASGYGKLLIIRHNYGFKTTFSHLNKFVAKYGDFVRKGDLIAYTGNSGLSNGPHLHYEVRYINRPLNPVSFVKWDMEHYNVIFDEEKEIQWLSLIQAVARQTYLLPPPSLHTALH